MQAASMGSTVLFFLSLFTIFSWISADASTTSDLLWPQPSSVKFGTAVYSIDHNFVFKASGAGASSNILRGALTRYQNILFDVPAPLRPSGNSAVPTGTLSDLMVEVSSDDESLNLSTDESCNTNYDT